MAVYSTITHNGQKMEAIKCPSTNEQINKTWYIHIMKYCSTGKENDTVIYATWMDLGNIKLGEISQI